MTRYEIVDLSDLRVRFDCAGCGAAVVVAAAPWPDPPASCPCCRAALGFRVRVEIVRPDA